MKRGSLAPSAFALTVLALLALPLTAQVDRTTLTGTVADATGGVLGARIRVADDGSGLERTDDIGERGAHVIPPLPIGTCTVQIGTGGFLSLRHERIELLVSLDPHIG